MEEDREDLVQVSDEESVTENEDLTAGNKPNFIIGETCTFTEHSRLHFSVVAFALTLSSTSLIILLPLYLETVNVKGDAYTAVFFTTTFTVLFLLILILIMNKLQLKKFVEKILKPSIKITQVLTTSVLYCTSGFMVVYATDRKRVMCHLQDPIKGIVLVFSLVYYFFFCRKMMGLQRIFSSTTIIVGLFISVDYGLCDEFRCRGQERARVADDAGQWPWKVHALWTAIYICGLSIFAAHYTLLERYLIPSQLGHTYTSISSTLLSTISRLVSNHDATDQQHFMSRPLLTTQNVMKPLSAVCLSFWIHIIGWAVVLFYMWTDMNANIGKANNISEFWNHSTRGFACHFATSISFNYPKNSVPECGNVSLFAWLFLFAYITFSISSIRFLILTQSAVFTVALTTTALPLSGIWWSLFHMTDVNKGLLFWNPSVTGELICSLLGLPIVLLGVVLLCKSHFKETAKLRRGLSVSQLT